MNSARKNICTPSWVDSTTTVHNASPFEFSFYIIISFEQKINTKENIISFLMFFSVNI